MSRRAAFSGQLTGDNATPPSNGSTAPPPSSSTSSNSQPTPRQPRNNNNNSNPTTTNANRGKGKQRPPHLSKPSSSQKEPIPLSGHLAAANLSALAAAASAKATLEAQGADGEGEDGQDENICFICAEPVQYWALGSCNHRTCHTCSIRLRALYKKRECTFCKVRLKTLSLHLTTRERGNWFISLLRFYRRNVIRSSLRNLKASCSRNTMLNLLLSVIQR